MHFGCERKKSRIGDWIGVSTVVARTPSSVASIVLGRSPWKYGPSDMAASTAFQSDIAAAMISLSEWREMPCSQSAFLICLRNTNATKGRAGMGTVSKNAVGFLSAVVANEMRIERDEGEVFLKCPLYKERCSPLSVVGMNIRINLTRILQVIGDSRAVAQALAGIFDEGNLSFRSFSWVRYVDDLIGYLRDA